MSVCVYTLILTSNLINSVRELKFVNLHFQILDDTGEERGTDYSDVLKKVDKNKSSPNVLDPLIKKPIPGSKAFNNFIKSYNKENNRRLKKTKVSEDQGSKESGCSCQKCVFLKPSALDLDSIKNISHCKQDGVSKCSKVEANYDLIRKLKHGDEISLIEGMELCMKMQIIPETGKNGDVVTTYVLQNKANPEGTDDIVLGGNANRINSNFFKEKRKEKKTYSLKPCGQNCTVLLELDEKVLEAEKKQEPPCGIDPDSGKHRQEGDQWSPKDCVKWEGQHCCTCTKIRMRGMEEGSLISACEANGAGF